MGASAASSVSAVVAAVSLSNNSRQSAFISVQVPIEADKNFKMKIHNKKRVRKKEREIETAR